ncbi:MAG: pirin family protein [Spirochaetales bacterium]|nr:pirin family protein [Spirochaetales bacterium]
MERRYREIKARLNAYPRREGAGVELVRAFGSREYPGFSPFIQCDEIRSADTKTTARGFPWHPHYGVTTVTYVFDGSLVYEETLSPESAAETGVARGELSAGDIQVIDAGRGIVHQELPRFKDEFWAVQLWLGQTARARGQEPSVRTYSEDRIPVYRGNDGLIVKVVSGEFRGYTGIVDAPYLALFLDIHIPPFGSFAHFIPDGMRVFSYVLEGQGEVLHPKGKGFRNRETLLFGDTGTLSFTGSDEELRLILCAGRIPDEDWCIDGPMAAGSSDELEEAYRRLERKVF